MEYRGYKAKYWYSDEDDCLIGRVLMERDIVTFHGNDEAECREAFHKALDAYLEDCEVHGEVPAAALPDEEQ